MASETILNEEKVLFRNVGKLDSITFNFLCTREDGKYNLTITRNAMTKGEYGYPIYMSVNWGGEEIFNKRIKDEGNRDTGIGVLKWDAKNYSFYNLTLTDILDVENALVIRIYDPDYHIDDKTFKRIPTYPLGVRCALNESGEYLSDSTAGTFKLTVGKTELEATHEIESIRLLEGTSYNIVPIPNPGYTCMTECPISGKQPPQELNIVLDYRNVYTIKYCDMDGVCHESDLQIHGEKFVLSSSTLDRTGYSQTGWSVTSDGSTDSYGLGQQLSAEKCFTQDMTLYPFWEPISYFIEYNGNGSTDTDVRKSIHIYDIETPLSINKFVRPGYKFIGWNSEPDGSGTSYSDKQSVINLTEEHDDVIVLYAVWKALATIFVKKNNTFYGGSPYIRPDEEWTKSIEVYASVDDDWKLSIM